MNVISNKNEVKDNLIIALIDTILELYTYNYKFDYDQIRFNILNKLKKSNLIDTEINESVLSIKKEINNLLINELPKTMEKKSLSIFNNYQNQTLIGNGSFSNVYKVYNAMDDQYYAVKKIGLDEYYLEKLEEIRSMAKLNHKNIIRYYSSWIESKKISNKLKRIKSINLELLPFDKLNVEDLNNQSSEYEYDESIYDKFIFIQMELCKYDLKKHIVNNVLSYDDKIKIVIEICDGLNYIHKNNIIHRDLKLNNILVNEDDNIKITDFGLATKLYDVNKDVVGSRMYIAPEVLDNGNYSLKSDLYSLGIIILEIFMKFKTNMEKVMLINDIKNGKSDITNFINVNKVLCNLISNDYENRYELEEIITFLS